MNRDQNGQLWVLVCIKPAMLRDDAGADLGPIARMHLREQGYDVLWLHYGAVRERRGKKWRVLRSRYPSLLYAAAGERQGFGPIDNTPGVVRMLRFGSDLALVPSRVIEAERSTMKNAEGLTDPPPWVGARGEAVYAAGQSVRSPHDAWAEYAAIVEADDGEVVRAWREVSGKRLWFSYHHHDVELA